MVLRNLVPKLKNGRQINWDEDAMNYIAQRLEKISTIKLVTIEQVVPRKGARCALFSTFSSTTIHNLWKGIRR